MATKTMAVLTTKPKIIAINGPKGRMELNGHPMRSLKVGKVTKFGVAVKGNLHEVQAVGPMIVTVDLSTDPLVKGRKEYREASKACTKAELANVPAGTMPKAESAEPAVTFTAKPVVKGRTVTTAKGSVTFSDVALAKRVAKMESLLETLIESMVDDS